MKKTSIYIILVFITQVSRAASWACPPDPAVLRGITHTCAQASHAVYGSEPAEKDSLRALKERYKVETLGKKEKILLIRGVPMGVLGDVDVCAFRGSVGLGQINEAREDKYSGSIALLGDSVARLFSKAPSSGCLPSYATEYRELVDGDSRILDALTNSVGPRKIVLTGHSRGGVFAQYAALEILSALAFCPPSILSVVTFGSPGAFNPAGASIYDSLIRDHKRFYFADDIANTYGPHTGAPIELRPKVSLTLPTAKKVGAVVPGLLPKMAAPVCGVHDKIHIHQMVHYLAAV